MTRRLRFIPGILSSLCLLLTQAAFAADKPVDATAVERYFQITGMEAAYNKELETSAAMMDQVFNDLADRPEFSEVKPCLIVYFRKMSSRFTALVDETFSWDKIKPIYIQAYSEVYTQTEFDALIAFYESPVGRSILEKGGVAREKTSAAMQSMMTALFQGFMNDAMTSIREIVTSAQEERARTGRLDQCLGRTTPTTQAN